MVTQLVPTPALAAQVEAASNALASLEGDAAAISTVSEIDDGDSQPALISNELTHSHHICGKDACDNGSHSAINWTGISSLDQITTMGNYYLMSDVTLNDTWTCQFDVNLCLNGYSIYGANNKEVIKVSSGKLTITDCQESVGKISHKDSNTGRGILVDGGALDFWNGCISGNSVTGEKNTDENSDGAGVTISFGTFNMYGGTIAQNTASFFGGGVSNRGRGTFNLYGGTIANNSAKYYAGVDNDGTFVMFGGSITGNSAPNSYGGGVGNHHIFNMSGGSITNNSASIGGGVFNESTFSLSDNVTIKGNADDEGSANNVFLSGAKIVVANGMSDDASVGITTWNPDGSPVVVTGTTDTKGFFSDNTKYMLTADDSSEGLKLVEIPHEHKVCGETGCTEHEGTELTWKKWTSADSLPTEPGDYFLTTDVTLRSKWECNGTINLCLNGKTITGPNGYDAILVNDGATLTITDCNSGGQVGKITHAENATGRGINVASGGTLTLWNGNITANSAPNNSGGGVVNGGTFNMHGGSITGNSADYDGGGVWNWGVFTMAGGSITGNSANRYSGGVYNTGTFTLSGAVIVEDNTASGKTNNIFLISGYTIGVAENGMGDGASVGISSQNPAGSPVVVTGTADNTGFFSDDADYGLVPAGSDGLKLQTAHKHKICGETNCTDNHGDDLTWRAWCRSGSLPTIAGNYFLTGNVTLASTWECNADVNICLNGYDIIGPDGDVVIEVQDGATLNITDCDASQTTGKITHVSNQMGGGISVVSGGTLILWNGSITGNAASDNAGGVCNLGTFEMRGGSITNNTAAGVAGGIYNSGELKLCGNVNITGNTVNEAPSNVYLSTDTKIDVIETGIADGTSVGIAAECPAHNLVVVSGTRSLKSFSSDNASYKLVADEGNNVLKLAEVHEHKICGNDPCDDGHDSLVWKAISSLDEIDDENDGENNYYLIGNVTLNSTWECKSNVNLCLNGHDIIGPNGNDAIKVNNGASLTITDCRETVGSITHASGQTGRGISVASGGTLIFWNGGVANNLTEDLGGGVYNAGTLEMRGGSIVGNSAQSGAVYNTGVFSVYGGSIACNTVTGNGGGVYNSGELAMTGGSITGNSAQNGAGVYNPEGRTFNMTGGSITGNTAKISAGGVYSNGAFTMSGGSVTENTASQTVGGVYGNGTLALSGNVAINNNKVGDADRNVYLPSGKTITVTGVGMDNGASVGITAEAPEDGLPEDGLLVVTGASATTGFSSDDVGYELLATSEGLSLLKVHRHAVCGETDCEHSGHDENMKWEPWTSTTSLPDQPGNYYLLNNVTLKGTWKTYKNVNLCLNGKTITESYATEVINVCSSLSITDCQEDAGKITHLPENCSARGVEVGWGYVFTLWNGTITGNAATSFGGGGVYNNGAFYMNGGAITGNTAIGGLGGGGVWNKGSFTMSGGSITGNFARSNGGGVYNTGSFAMSGGSITGNTTGYNGAGLYNYGTLNLSGNVTIKDNKVGDAANNVFLVHDRKITVAETGMGEKASVGITAENPDDSPVVVSGTAKTENFSCDYNDCELVPSGDSALILSRVHKHNVCGASGCDDTDHNELTWTAWTSTNALPSEPGNYYLIGDVTLSETWDCSNNVNLCLNGKTIYGPNGYDTIKVNGNASLAITDCHSDEALGKITHNSDETGSGIFVDENSTLTLWNGNITNNSSANFGGGVYNAGTFKMVGGIIKNNSANDVGGGVYNRNTFTMIGGSIANNSALVGGGGIGSDGTLTMSGMVIVKDNTVNNRANNVYLSTSKKLNVVERGMADDASVGITSENPGNGDTVVTGSTDTTVFSSDDANFELVTDGNGQLKLAVKTAAISGVKLLVSDGGEELSGDETAKSKVYDGAAVAYDAAGVALDPSTLTDVELSYTWQVKDGGIYTDISNNAAPSDAGSYRLLVTAKRGDVNLGTLELPFTIVAKSLTVNATAEDKTYDGGTAATLKSAELDGVLDADKGAVSLDSSKVAVAFEDKNAGDSKAVTATVAEGALFGDKAGNYAVATATAANAKIGRRPLTVSVTAKDKTYDGNATATVGASMDATGVVGGDAVALDATGVTAAFSSKDAGEDKPVTLTGEYTLCGSAAGNYVLTQPTGLKASIAQREVTVGGLSAAKSYDGDATAEKAEIAGTAALGNTVAGDDVSLDTEGMAGTFDSANAGEATIVTLTGLSLAGADKGNYRLPETVTCEGTITKAAGSGEVKLDGWTYGDEANGPVPSSSTNGAANVTYQYKAKGAEDESYTADKPIAAGDYTVRATFPATANYTEATATADFTVSRRVLTATITAKDKTYDGTDAAEVTRVELTGVLDGESVTATASGARFASANAGDGQDVTADVALDDPAGAAKNYSVAATATAKACIAPKTLTVTAAVSDKAYDGGTAATVTGVELSGKVAGDAVSLNRDNMAAAFEDAGAGENKTVTVTGLALDNNDDNNYKLPDSITATANITKAAGSGEVKLDGWTYGEAAKSPRPTSSTNGAYKVTYLYKVKGAGDETYSDSVPTAAGTYTVKATFAETANYKAVNATADFAIAKKQLTIAGATVAEKTYDGMADANVTAVNFDGLVGSDALAIDTDYIVTGAVFDSADADKASKVDFSVALKDTGTAKNYTLASAKASQQANIKKATIEGSLSFTDNGKRGQENTCDVPAGYVVDGGQVTVSVDKDENGILDGTPAYADGKLSYKLRAGAAEGQTATVRLAVSSGNYDNYAIAAILGVTAREQVKIDVAGGDYTYNGAAQAPTDIKVQGEKVAASDLVKTYVGTGVTKYGPSAQAPAAAGSYSVTVSVAETNLEYTGSGGCEFQISPKALTITAAAKGKAYDGNATATVDASLDAAGVVGGDAVTLDATGVTAAFDNKDAGQNKPVALTGEYKLGGAAAGNYVLTQPTGLKASIAQREVTVGGLSAAKSYDGDATAEKAEIAGTAALGNTVAGDDVSLDTDNMRGAFNGKDAGDNKTVTLSGLSLTGADKGNYRLPGNVTCEGEISRRAVTLASEDHEFTYNGQAQRWERAGVAAGSFADGEGVASYSFSGSATNAGDSVDNAFAYELKDGTSADNYEIATTYGKLTVAKAGTMTVSGTGYAGVYDGAEHGPAAQVNVTEGTKVEYSVDGGAWSETAPAVRDVADVTVRVRATNPNYEAAEATYALKVTRRPVTFTGNSGARTYNGSEQSVSGFTANDGEGAGLVAGHEATLEASASRMLPGTTAGAITAAKDVVIRDAQGDDVTGDYDITTNPGAITIERVAGTVTIEAASASKTYDGAPLADGGFTYTEGVLVEGDVLTAVVEGSATDVGDAGVNAVTSHKVTRGDTDVTCAYTFGESVDGKLTVTAQSIVPDGAKPESYKGVTIADPSDVVYNGAEQKRAPEVKGPNGNALVEGTDYTVAYSGDTTNVGTVTVTIQGIGNYIGTSTKTYKITPAPLAVGTPSASKVYDGSPLTADATADSISGLVNNETAAVVANGSRTDAGSSENGYVIEWGTAKSTNYTIQSESLGTLTVTAKSIVPDSEGKGGMTANDPSDVAYDGQEHKWVPVVKDGEKVLVEGTDYEVSYNNRADFTNVDGAITVTITGKGNYSGGLDRTYRIGKARLSVVTESGSKSYDGQALTADGAIGGFVNGESAAFKVTGSQTTVGSSTNTYEIDWAGATARQGNYEISEQLGTLSVTESANEVVVTTTGGTWTYDGQPHGATVAVTNLPAGYTAQATSSAAATDANGDGIAATADNLVIRNTEGLDVTNDLKVTKVDGAIKIEPAEISVETFSAKKGYDGPALTAGGKVSGLVGGEAATLVATGSQTVVGKSDNTYRIEWNDNAKESNYTIASENIGTLEVTANTAAIYVVPTGATKVYDGTALEGKDSTAMVMGVPNGFTSSYALKGSQTDKGQSYVEVDTFKIFNAAGDDVTSNFSGINTEFKGSLNVTARPVALTSASASKVYDGTELTAHAATASEPAKDTGMVAGQAFDLEFFGSQTAEGSSGNTFVAKSSPTADVNNYSITYTNGTLAVGKQAITPGTDPENPDPAYKGIEIGDPKNVVYDASEHKWSPEVTGKDGSKLVEGTDYEVSYSTADFTNATGTITVTITGKGNYTGTVTKAYEITKADGAGEVKLAGWTYGDEANGPVPSSDTNGTDEVTYQYKVKGADDGSYSDAVPSAAGEYTVRATFAATANYEAADATADFTIKKRALTVKGLAVADKAYDGTTAAAIDGTPGLDAAVEGDDVSLACGEPTFSSASAGENITVNFTAFSLAGDDAGNYTLIQPSGVTGTISPATLIVTGADVAPKTYDGAADATVTAVTFTGLVGGESLALGADYTVFGAKYDGANATGEGAATKATFSVALADTVLAKNYALAGAAGEQAATIDKATVSYPQTTGYGLRGSCNACVVPAEYVVSGGAVTVGGVDDASGILDGAPAYADGKLSYRFTAAATDGQEATVTLKVTSANYEDYALEVILGVTPKKGVQVKIADAGATYTYSGSAQAPSGVSVEGNAVQVGDLVVTYAGTDGTAYAPSAQAPTAAGSYVMTAAVAGDDPEFYGSATCGFRIAKKPVAVKGLSVADKLYDGTTAAAIAGAPSVDGAVEGDDVALVNGSPTFTSAKVGEKVAVTFTDFSLSGEDAANYELAQPTGVSASILAYDAKGSEYSATTGEWTNEDFTVTAAEGWKVALSDSADADWRDGLTCPEEGVGSLTFYVRNDAQGHISTAVTLGHKIDKTAPTGKVEVGKDAWDEFLETVTFGLYRNEKQTVTLTGADALSGVEKVEYLVTDKDLSVEQLADEEFAAYDGPFDIEPDASVIVYARITDKAGNVTYLRSDGVVLDATAPVVAGAEDGRTYCGPVELTVTDANLASVTLNGEPAGEAAALGADAAAGVTLTVGPAAGEQVVTATDKAGNATTLTLTVNDGHTWGDWSSNGDGTHSRACRFDAAHTQTADCHGGKATCSARAVCDDCGGEHGDLDESNHADLVHVEAREATVETEGNTEYWYCPACGRLFSDAAGQHEVSRADTVIARKPAEPEGDKADPAGAAKSPAKAGSPETGDAAAPLALPALLGTATVAAALVSARKKRRDE